MKKLKNMVIILVGLVASFFFVGKAAAQVISIEDVVDRFNEMSEILWQWEMDHREPGEGESNIIVAELDEDNKLLLIYDGDDVLVSFNYSDEGEYYIEKDFSGIEPSIDNLMENELALHYGTRLLSVVGLLAGYDEEVFDSFDLSNLSYYSDGVLWDTSNFQLDNEGGTFLNHLKISLDTNILDNLILVDLTPSISLKEVGKDYVLINVELEEDEYESGLTCRLNRYDSNYNLDDSYYFECPEPGNTSIIDDEPLNPGTKYYYAVKVVRGKEVSNLLEVTTDSKTGESGIYKIISGANSTYYMKSKKGLEIKADGDITSFVGLKLDGKVVDPKNYDLKEGSTIVTLKSSYLDTLKEGKHTLTFVYEDGSVDTNFTVKAKNPKTLDGIMAMTGLLMVSLLGVYVACQTISKYN